LIKYKKVNVGGCIRPESSANPVHRRPLPRIERIKMDRIIANPKILGGKPVIKGTRIAVEFILELLASGVGESEILQDYPHLSKDDISACLRYAAKSLKNEIYLDLEVA
jgi:uncharacterized protein (DUF433 family)